MGEPGYAPSYRGRVLCLQADLSYSDIVTNDVHAVITTTTQVNIVNDNGTNKYTLNGKNSYIDRYAIQKTGMYSFKNVPQSHPLAIICSNTTQLLISGDSSKYSTKTVDGSLNHFYYGDISLNVLGNFTKASLYCYNHGYMGGQNILHYANLSWNVVGAPINPPTVTMMARYSHLTTTASISSLNASNVYFGEMIGMDGTGKNISATSYRYNSNRGYNLSLIHI